MAIIEAYARALLKTAAQLRERARDVVVRRRRRGFNTSG